ncbi:MAG: MBL fold metallo-hydrolase [Bacteroidetes bacterium]|nr:MBL fold metallo-hydrolase [Bacteroidota bacterium]
MSNFVTFLGGVEEIGANSCFLNLDGTGIIIDTGLHPRLRNEKTFPTIFPIQNEDTDYILLTHAHNDHIGGLPYILKHFPHLKIISTHATREILEVMLQNTGKLLRVNPPDHIFSSELEYYKPNNIQEISSMVEGVKYSTPLELLGRQGNQPISVSFLNAGHILGSAGILLTINDKNIFHTGDVQFRNQALISKAVFPKHHLDCLICECTNGRTEDETPDYKQESKRLASFINNITNNNGSVLIPSFALGKTQEMLTVLYQLMRKAEIPTLPIYSGGISKKLSNIYDRYCYDGGRVSKGFEVEDIPQIPINHDELMTDSYFKSPSIVVASSGMMNAGTTSYKLAMKWMQRANFGIAFIGYQDDQTPGYAMLHSELKKNFQFGGQSLFRKCQIGKFRFSAHAGRSDLLDFILNASPKQLYLIHGDEDACSSLALTVMEHLPQTKVIIPTLAKRYQLSV